MSSVEGARRHVVSEPLVAFLYMLCFYSVCPGHHCVCIVYNTLVAGHTVRCMLLCDAIGPHTVSFAEAARAEGDGSGE